MRAEMMPAPVHVPPAPPYTAVSTPTRAKPTKQQTDDAYAAPPSQNSPVFDQLGSPAAQQPVSPASEGPHKPASPAAVSRWLDFLHHHPQPPTRWRT